MNVSRPGGDDLPIRPARPQDAEEVAAVASAAYSPYTERMGRDPAPMGEDYAEVIASPSVFVVTRGDRVAGYVVLRADEDAMLLENVAVGVEHQGRGIGRLLIAHAEEWARGTGHGRMRLYTNEAMTENLRLYVGLGYVETSRVLEDGYRRVYLEKSLAT